MVKRKLKSKKERIDIALDSLKWELMQTEKCKREEIKKGNLLEALEYKIMSSTLVWAVEHIEYILEHGEAP